MAISIDTSRPLLRPTDVANLVRGVLGATRGDETDWIEWKSIVDLSLPEGRCHAARHILGFSNRDPDRAARTAGGWGYLVIGAEPRILTGAPIIDPADLEQALRPYLGDVGPQWIPSNVEVDGSNVLVIAVEPPRWGDPIRTLRKEYGNYRSGDVFVRRNGATHKANAAEMEALQRRLVTQVVEQLLDIELASEPGSLLSPIDYRSTDLDDWVEVERARRMRSLQTYTPEPSSLVPAIFTERRSSDEYAGEVESYLRQCRTQLSEQLTEAAINLGTGSLRTKISNLTEHNFPGVRVILEFSSDVPAAEDDFVARDLPKPPIPYGKLNVPGIVPDALDLSGLASTFHSDVEIEEEGDIHRATFVATDLRPDGIAKLPIVHLFPRPSLAGSVLSISWSATSTGVSGVARGVLEVPVAEKSVTTEELLKRVLPVA